MDVRVAQYAKPGALDDLEGIFFRAFLEGILTVAKEREMIVGDPIEETPRFGKFLGLDAIVMNIEFGDGFFQLTHHRLPVFDGGARIGQHPLDAVFDLLASAQR